MDYKYSYNNPINSLVAIEAYLCVAPNAKKKKLLPQICENGKIKIQQKCYTS